MRNAEKNIPRAIHSSMFVVVVSGNSLSLFEDVAKSIQILFMLANVSYFVVLDKVSAPYLPRASWLIIFSSLSSV